ncbi:hypothetical protein WOLCODRAFT_163798 [Wolfiporia cocos MD-104 SS10]|uniref:Uncharacterized protein n=1 Tax=Wolfiporia cocos (strain MD-104) TaxID=742152 RepID=A0A2H3JJU7_WOLCO|nr:hypothetical protein WOLCODRAFT_163798 [Wolfiporia cocos MD-104 SS10]
MPLSTKTLWLTRGPQFIVLQREDTPGAEPLGLVAAVPARRCRVFGWNMTAQTGERATGHPSSRWMLRRTVGGPAHSRLSEDEPSQTIE